MRNNPKLYISKSMSFSTPSLSLIVLISLPTFFLSYDLEFGLRWSHIKYIAKSAKVVYDSETILMKVTHSVVYQTD